MKNVRQTNINIHRDSWVEINLENIAYNMRSIRKNSPEGIKLLAVVKAKAKATLSTKDESDISDILQTS